MACSRDTSGKSTKNSAKRCPPLDVVDERTDRDAGPRETGFSAEALGIGRDKRIGEGHGQWLERKPKRNRGARIECRSGGKSLDASPSGGLEQVVVEGRK